MNTNIERHISPSVGEFAIQDRQALIEENEKLRSVLQQSQALRPALLVQYGAVPECVLDFCNRARAAVTKARA